MKHQRRRSKINGIAAGNGVSVAAAAYIENGIEMAWHHRRQRSGGKWRNQCIKQIEMWLQQSRQIKSGSVEWHLVW